MTRRILLFVCTFVVVVAASHYWPAGQEQPTATPATDVAGGHLVLDELDEDLTAKQATARLRKLTVRVEDSGHHYRQIRQNAAADDE